MNIQSTLLQREISPVSLRRNILTSKSLIQRYTKGFSLLGHEGCVNSILFSDDGRNVITASDDTKIKIFNVFNGKILKTIATKHTQNIFHAKDLPESNGDIIVSCAADGQVIQTLLSNDKSKVLHEHEGRAHRLAGDEFTFITINLH